MQTQERSQSRSAVFAGLATLLLHRSTSSARVRQLLIEALNHPVVDMEEDKEEVASEDMLEDLTYAGQLLDLQPPQPCCWLRPGQAFTGFQRCSLDSLGHHPQRQDWTVTLRVHSVDLAQGTAEGVMEAVHVSNQAGPEQIVTYWDAELVDNTNNTLFTNRWGASHSTDLDFWSKLGGVAFPDRMRLAVATHGGQCELHSHTHVFLRLKEREFVTGGPESSISIAGFYYLSLDRQTGIITGFYCDPCPISTPQQYLELRPLTPGGYASGSVAFA